MEEVTDSEEERWKDRDEEVVREQRVRALLERADVSAAWLTEHREWDQDNVAALDEGASLYSISETEPTAAVSDQRSAVP